MPIWDEWPRRPLGIHELKDLLPSTVTFLVPTEETGITDPTAKVRIATEYAIVELTYGLHEMGGIIGPGESTEMIPVTDPKPRWGKAHHFRYEDLPEMNGWYKVNLSTGAEGIHGDASVAPPSDDSKTTGQTKETRIAKALGFVVSDGWEVSNVSTSHNPGELLVEISTRFDGEVPNSTRPVTPSPGTDWMEMETSAYEADDGYSYIEQTFVSAGKNGLSSPSGSYTLDTSGLGVPSDTSDTFRIAPSLTKLAETFSEAEKNALRGVSESLREALNDAE